MKIFNSGPSSLKFTSCVDTSMGFTPLDGVAMGTRDLSVDPSLLVIATRQDLTIVGETRRLLLSEGHAQRELPRTHFTTPSQKV